MAVETGARAPDFTLPDQDRQPVTLSERLVKGPVVLAFFPAAFSGVCTTEMCDVTAGLSAYSSLGADVIGISVASPFAQEAWAKQHNIGITLASDLNKTTAKAYGVLLDDLLGFGSTSARAAFVVGKDGVVKYAEQTATPKDLPNFAAVRAALA